jgi:hypothetical protein
MNKEQRKEISKITYTLEEMAYDEQEKYDMAPENLQDTDRVLKFEENADTLQEAIDVLTELLEN